MSTTIDQRVVEMRFDNKNFEDNVAESISTLDKLKGALNFDKVAGAFDTVTKAAGKVDFSPISSGIETVMVKFNVFEMAAVQAISNIINNGIYKLKGAVDMLTFDQVMAGWDKFEQKTSSVQTIMSATGKTVEEVSEQLERLNWFSDETSYSFTDMTSNVGKFTSVGVDLETAVSAMEGISTWAALSGGTSAEASRAMYNLSQAMSVGAVKLMDWRSIQNAGMATQEFKEVALETAAAMGTLKKNADGTFQSIEKGTEITAKNFDTTLSEGWFTDKVLLRSLESYGSFANELSIVCKDLDVTAEDMVSAIQKYDGSAESLQELMDETNKSAAELKPILDHLSSSEYELGRKAFYAAQEAKTFHDAIDATTDAVSTKWMNIFETLFGNYEQAKGFFTKMSKVFYEIFADPVDQLGKFLKRWSEVKETLSDGSEGRSMGEVFRTGITDALWGIYNVIEIVKSTFAEIVPQVTVERLVELTIKFGQAMEEFEHFTAEFSISESATERLQRVWSGFAAVIDIFRQAFSALKPLFMDAVKVVGVLADDILSLSAAFGDWLTETAATIREQQIFQNVLEKIRQILSPLTDKISELYGKLKQKISTKELVSFADILEKIEEKLAPVWTWINRIFETVGNFFSAHNITGIFSDIWNWLKNIGDTLAAFASTIDFTAPFRALEKLLISIGGHVKNLFSGFSLTGFMDSFSKSVGNLADTLGSSNFDGLFSNLTKSMMVYQGFSLGKLFGNAGDAIGSVKEGGILGFLKNLASPVTDLFDQLKDTISSFTRDTDEGKLKSIATAIGILTAALWVLSGIDADKIDSGLKGVSVTMAEMLGSIYALTKMDLSGGKQMKNVATAMVEMAAAAWIMSKAVTPFAEMNTDQLIKAGAAMTVILGEMIGFIAAFGAVSRANQIGNTDSKGFFGLFQKSNGFDKQLKKAAEAMILLGAALKIFASAAKDFGSIGGDGNWEALGKAAAAITVLLLEMLGFAALAGNMDSGKVMGVSAAMIVLGAAFKIMASVAGDFGNMTNDAVIRGVGMMTLVMIEMGAFMVASTEFVDSAGKLAAVAASMMLFGIAMQEMAAVAVIVSLIDSAKLADSMAFLAVSLLEMISFMLVASGLSQYTGGIAAIAASMVLFGLALQSFAAAAIMFSAVKWEDMGKMGAVFAVVAAALALMSPILPAIGAGLTSVGIGMMAIGAGITLIGIGIASISFGVILGKIGDIADRFIWLGNQISSMGESIRTALSVETIIQLLTALPTIFTGAISGIFAGIVSGIGTIIGSLGDLIDGAKTLILSLLDLVGDVAPKLIETVLKMLLDTLRALGNNVPEMLTVVLDLVLKIAEGLVDYIPQIVSTLVNLLVKLIDSLAEHIPTLLTSVMNFVGALFGDILKKIEEFLFNGDLAQGFGEVMGRFIGGILDGVGQAIQAGLPDMGKSLSEFMTNLQPFLDGVKGVDSATMQSISTLAKAILVLSAADLVKGLAEFITGKSNLEGFGQGLANFAPKFRQFADQMYGIDTVAVSTAATAIRKIAEVFNMDAFKTGGVKQWFTGEMTDLEKFGDGIIAIGPKIVMFASAVRGIDESAVTNSQRVKGVLAVFNDETFKTGGLKQWVNGEMVNLEAFGDAIVTFGPKVMAYAESIRGIDPEAAKNSINAALAVNALASNLPSKSLTERLFGTSGADTFIADLLDFGAGIALFYQQISGIDAQHVSTVTAAVRDILDLTKGAGEIKASIDKSFGESMVKIAQSGIDSFMLTVVSNAEKIQTNAKDLMDKFIAAVKGKSGEAVNTAVSVVNAMVDGVKKKGDSFKSAGIDLVTSFILGVKSERTNVSDTIVEMLTNSLTKVKEKASDFFKSGMDLIDGMILGMYAKAESLNLAVQLVGEAAVDQMNKTLGIQSPSKVFYQIGSYAGEGFVNGLSAWLGAAGASSQALGDSAMSLISSAIDDYLQNDFESEPVIRPVLDLSAVEAGSGRLNSLLSSSLAYSTGAEVEEAERIASVSSVDNTRNYGGFTFNIYSNATDTEEVARELGAEVARRMRIFSTI